jgi:cyclopropane fatty-acyl-phospholipid synthase-like methyltransferase
MSGWEPKDFSNNKQQFLEFRQEKSFNVYKDFFKKCASWLKDDGLLIMHTGKTLKCDMAEHIIPFSTQFFNYVYHFNECVEGKEKFGIKDQGATKMHQYIFFTKK